MELYIVCLYDDDEIYVYTTKEYKTHPRIDKNWNKAITVEAKSILHAAYLEGKEDR